MNKRMTSVVLLVLTMVLPMAWSGMVAASGGHGARLDHVKIDLGDQAALQRGARIFVNYCLSCHSAAYMRYNRVGQDLGISEELVKENLLFAADKPGELMKAVMPREDAKLWFGVAPPDLTLITRSRGPDWFYTYMRSFYRDDKSVSGWNNSVFEHVAMPHVLYEWQGHQVATFKDDGHGMQIFEGFELSKPGSMTPREYDGAMRDLTHFMVYLGEPARLQRVGIGVWTLLFLGVFGVVAYLLKKEYWKDVH